MASRSDSKKARLREWITANQPRLIDEDTWLEIRERLAHVTDSYLRRLLRETAIPLAPLVEGVSQRDFAELERTLLALQEEYQSSPGERGERCRAAVILAKDHARLHLRRQGIDQDQREVKEEMLLWMMTWLENPSLFSTWLSLRKRASAAKLESAGSASKAKNPDLSF
ncbi:MAG: hypothetical protein ACRD7E_23650 [Bryobacteraceae bacterium]